MNELKMEFRKLNLKPDDIFIIKVDTSGLSEQEASKKMAEIREDEFVKYIEEQGTKVVVSYTGLDFQILRVQAGDKVLAYADVSSMNEEEEHKYLDYIKFKLDGAIENLVCVPVREKSPTLRVATENNDV